MNVHLERGDLLQLDAISNCGTLKLLPPGKKLKQKLVIGDDSGTVGCYEFKKGDPQVVFINKPFEGPITSVAIGGPQAKRDKIFASHSQRVVGINKKGKEFFKLTSSLTESIRSIVVEDAKIYSGCEFIYNLYDDGRDTAFYMSSDVINGIAVENITRETDYDVALACQDRCIRIVAGSQSVLEIPVAGAVTSVTTLTTSRANGAQSVGSGAEIGEAKMKRGATGLLYGLESGGIGFVQIDRGGALGPSWCVEDTDAEVPSAVTSIITADLLKDGVNEVLVGRNDGRVEVFAQRGSLVGGMTLHPVKIFSATIGETVRSVCCGLVNSADFHELVVAGYSGKVISFTSEPVLQRAPDDSYGRSQQTVNNENRIKHIRGEIKALQQKVDKEKEKLKSLSSGQGGAKTLLDKANSLGAQDFPVNSSFSLDSQQAMYRLSIEIQSPLDMVILRSPAMLELKESDLGATVVSVVPSEYLIDTAEGSSSSSSSEQAANQSKFVAAYRCQNGEKRLSIALRPTEGFFGDLTVIIVACCSPKAAKFLKFPLKPLSLHQKVHEFTAEQAASRKSKVRFVGGTSINIAHEWLQFLLPEVPPRLADDAEEARYLFVNCFTNAVTVCAISRNEISIESDSVSTISIAKETLARLASQRRQQLEELVTIDEEGTLDFLAKLWPRLSYQLSLSQKMEILESLREISMQEKDSSIWLSPEYSEILASSETLTQAFKVREKSLEYLIGVVSDLYVDWKKALGLDSVHQIPDVQKVIRSNDLQAVLSLFDKKNLISRF